jgi:hypothetical protein
VKTLQISLLVTVIATGAWILDLGRDIWPAHPLWAEFFLTLAATIILMRVVPGKEKEKDKDE